MNTMESILAECIDLIDKGSSRDDIDTLLKKKGIDNKEIAAIDLELQPIFLKIEVDKLEREKSTSYIVAGYITWIIAVIFSIYTILAKGYWSLLICIFLVLIGYHFISKGRTIRRDMLNDGGFRKYSQFQKLRNK